MTVSLVKSPARAVHAITIDETRDGAADIAYRAFCECPWAGDWHHADRQLAPADPLSSAATLDGTPVDAAAGLAWLAANAEGLAHVRAQRIARRRRRRPGGLARGDVAVDLMQYPPQVRVVVPVGGHILDQREQQVAQVDVRGRHPARDQLAQRIAHPRPVLGVIGRFPQPLGVIAGALQQPISRFERIPLRAPGLDRPRQPRFQVGGQVRWAAEERADRRCTGRASRCCL